MGLPETLINQFHQVWTVEHCASERLTHIGGFLITYGDLSRVTISTRLSEADQTRGRNQLLNYLSNTPVGTAHILLWHPADAADP